ncbi:hypothetical protein DB313_06275 (plasmid) [Borrelia turcica IST7]|uniref:DUF228 domain-containing protein n=1 Tax=Borrelia turcica IST7 TaxID=1104446 RepID=A0A386PNR6_9SPIR|nr:DUF228 domain-containing protein [Borrelia turcica]AYE37106.1 hypothetical protein DB313_06275 [Borrelia turcica IST7]
MAIEQLEKEYIEKREQVKKIMKNPIADPDLFSNRTEHRDKNLIFSNSGGTATSRFDKIENYFAKGYPYKRGVKLVVNKVDEGQPAKPHYEPHIEAGGGDDLYGICIDIDEYSQIATVLPITNNFQGYLVAKDSSIKRADKLCFNIDGELEKSTAGKANINAIALADAIELVANKQHVVKVAVIGNRALDKN